MKKGCEPESVDVGWWALQCLKKVHCKQPFFFQCMPVDAWQVSLLPNLCSLYYPPQHMCIYRKKGECVVLAGSDYSSIPSLLLAAEASRDATWVDNGFERHCPCYT